jgi:AcrR family transcriptional regulator
VSPGGQGEGQPTDPFADPLYVALIDVVAERGYAEAGAAEVLARAGRSRAEFEARFADWEEFVLAVLGAFIDDFTERIQRAYDSEPGWRQGLRASAYSTAAWLEENPRVARFGAVDVLAARSEMIQVRREGVFQYCAELIDRGRAAAPDPAAVPETAAVTAVGSIAQILTQRLQAGEDLETEKMVPALMYQAVRPYLGEEVAREELTMVPPGAGGADEGGGGKPDPHADPVATALVELIAERGYEATDVEAVIVRAGIDRTEFERRFIDKEDCVLKVYEAFIADFEAEVRTAYEAFSDWPTSLRAAAYAAADWMEARPQTARFGGVDVLYARNEMVRVRREEVFQYCAGLIEAGRSVSPDPAAVPEAAAIMAIGAVAQMLTQRMQRDEDLEYQRMVPELMYAAVRPYLGEETARIELGAPRPSLPPAD